jgi:60 kDa SS-A/Ro ribonucleoprotein
MTSPYVNYAIPVFANLTPQTRPIPGREADMVANNAGGVGFKLDDWERLRRFLVIGSDGGTYYVGQRELTEQNAACVIRCIAIDGPRVVAEAKSVNIQNLAPKVEPQLFALALCFKHGDLPTRQAALSAAPAMLRIGTHVLHLTAMLDSMKGWGRLKKRVLANWFLNRDPDALAFQILKYRSRS